MKNYILIFGLVLTGLVLSCKKKDNSKTTSTSTTTNTTAPTYSTATFQIALIDIQTSSFPYSFGSNKKFYVVASGVRIDSMTTGFGAINYFSTNPSFGCSDSTTLTTVYHTFKIRTDVNLEYLEYYEGTDHIARFTLHNDGTIYGSSCVSPTGGKIVDAFYNTDCSRFCFLKY